MIFLFVVLIMAMLKSLPYKSDEEKILATKAFNTIWR